MAKALDAIKFDFTTENLELSKAKNDKGFYIRGYASVGEVIDRQDEIIGLEALQGAVDELLKLGDTLFFNHDYNRPIGRITKAKVDRKGLFIEALISKSEAQIIQKIQEGILKRFSIGGEVLEFETVRDEKSGQEIMRITKMKLFEVSLVGLPANPFAEVVDFVMKSYSRKSKAINMLETKKYSIEEITKIFDKEDEAVKKTIREALENHIREQEEAEKAKQTEAVEKEETQAQKKVEEEVQDEKKEDAQEEVKEDEKKEEVEDKEDVEVEEKEVKDEADKEEKEAEKEEKSETEDKDAEEEKEEVKEEVKDEKAEESEEKKDEDEAEAKEEKQSEEAEKSKDKNPEVLVEKTTEDELDLAKKLTAKIEKLEKAVLMNYKPCLTLYNSDVEEIIPEFGKMDIGAEVTFTVKARLDEKCEAAKEEGAEGTYKLVAFRVQEVDVKGTKKSEEPAVEKQEKSHVEKKLEKKEEKVQRKGVMQEHVDKETGSIEKRLARKTPTEVMNDEALWNELDEATQAEVKKAYKLGIVL